MQTILTRARPLIAFTALNTVLRKLDKRAESILDIGCGKGDPIRFINRNHRYYCIGVDIFLPYLKKDRENKIHDDYVLCDVRFLPFKKKSFDIALCMEVLEHLERNDGYQLIIDLEEVACKQVVMTTPIAEYKQSVYDKNPYQEHKWLWLPVELEYFGYGVRGAGIRKISGDEGLASRVPKILKPLKELIWVMTGFLTYYQPLIAGHMICYKMLGSNKIKIISALSL